jgi:hypothetical protein
MKNKYIFKDLLLKINNECHIIKLELIVHLKKI